MAHTKFHLGYFTKFGPTSWPCESNAFAAQWADGSYHKELARILEAAKFDFILFEDTVIVGDRYGGSMELEFGKQSRQGGQFVAFLFADFVPDAQARLADPGAQDV